MTNNQTDNQPTWTKEAVIAAFEEAHRTLRKLPAEKVSGYFSSWPEILYTEAEIAKMDKKPKQWFATPESISRLERTCSWMRFIAETESRKIIWLRASRTPWKLICHKFGISRPTASKNWQKAICRIVQQLEELPLWAKI